MSSRQDNSHAEHSTKYVRCVSRFEWPRGAHEAGFSTEIVR